MPPSPQVWPLIVIVIIITAYKKMWELYSLPDSQSEASNKTPFKYVVASHRVSASLLAILDNTLRVGCKVTKVL